LAAGILVATALLVLLVPAGCAREDAISGPLNQHSFGVAITDSEVALDQTLVQVVTPLDRLSMLPNESGLVEVAAAIVVNDCMAASGHERYFSEALLREYLDHPPLSPDWRFGLWNAPYVAEYGPIGEGHEVLERLAGPENDSKEYLDALDECRNSASALEFEAISIHSPVTSDRGDLLLETSVAAYDRAQTDPRWEEVVREWQSCAVAKGLTISSDWELSSQESDGTSGAGPLGDEFTSEEMQASVIEAECSDSVNATEDLASVVARYELELVSARWSDFEELYRAARTTVEEAGRLVSERM
jgi:hypothetical protein